jgi:3-keto-5-aminohexanoate cleavage enzyme
MHETRSEFDIDTAALLRSETMGQPVWLEVALNGAWTRSRQPLIPVSPEEIIAQGIACAKAGASILHYHAYDPLTGQQTSAVDVNVRILEGIKSKVDVIVYPAITGLTALQALTPEAGQLRYATNSALADLGLMEWMVVDPGTVNMSPLVDSLQTGGPQGYLYVMTEPAIAHGLTLAQQKNVRPSYAIYEPGFLRLGAALAHRHDCLTPIYRLMFSDQFSFSFPPSEHAIEIYHRYLQELVPNASWMVAGLGFDASQWIVPTVELGGHIRVGLEDAILGTDQSNVAQAEAAAHQIIKSGHDLASAQQVRKHLASREAR